MFGCPLQDIPIGELGAGEPGIDGMHNVVAVAAAAQLPRDFRAVQLIQQEADYARLRRRSQASRSSR
jgi:hypothetical protein